jgi:hypothetical protein
MQKTLTFLAAGIALAALPALAHAQAGHPNFTGAWTVTPYTGALKPADGKDIPFKPEFKAQYDKHLAAAKAGDKKWDPAGECLPEGLPRIMIINEPFEILQRDKGVYFVAQNRVPWKAFFGEQLPADPDPFYMGYSVARWDGNTLVIDSSGFRDLTMLDDKGIPHTEQLKVESKFNLGADGKTMTATYTITDPGAFTRPWTAKASFAKKPDSFQMPEEVCAEKLTTTAPKRAS